MGYTQDLGPMTGDIPAEGVWLTDIAHGIVMWIFGIDQELSFRKGDRDKCHPCQ